MDPLADLVDWIALYGVVGLLSIGLAERFVPALPSHGVLVAIGIAANDDIWSVHTALAGTTIGSSTGALALYLLVRAFGERKSDALLYFIGKWIRLSRQRIDQTLSSLRAREQTITITSQLIPTIRLISPLAAALLGTITLRFASRLPVGIVLWNGLLPGCDGTSRHQLFGVCPQDPIDSRCRGSARCLDTPAAASILQAASSRGDVL